MKMHVATRVCMRLWCMQEHAVKRVCVCVALVCVVIVVVIWSEVKRNVMPGGGGGHGLRQRVPGARPWCFQSDQMSEPARTRARVIRIGRERSGVFRIEPLGGIN